MWFAYCVMQTLRLSGSQGRRGPERVWRWSLMTGYGRASHASAACPTFVS